MTPPQATVATYDSDSRSGTVLFDDGSALPFDTAAFDRGGLLTLRVGQRVRLVLDGSDEGRSIAALTIVTLAFPPGVEAGGHQRQ